MYIVPYYRERSPPPMYNAASSMCDLHDRRMFHTIIVPDLYDKCTYYTYIYKYIYEGYFSVTVRSADCISGARREAIIADLSSRPFKFKFLTVWALLILRYFSTILFRYWIYWPVGHFLSLNCNTKLKQCSVSGGPWPRSVRLPPRSPPSPSFLLHTFTLKVLIWSS
jgi:hypothetical protein